jgi:uncharacterized protein YndB with AHSA1/START domain
MAERTRGYAHRVDVAAPMDLLWRGLVAPELLSVWYGKGARVDPRRGGRYCVRSDRDLAREAHIDVFEPGRRLRLIYMPPPDLPPCDAVVVDDFILDLEPGNSVLRLLGSGFPQDEAWDLHYNRLRSGWALALARLKVCIEQQHRRATRPPGDSAAGTAAGAAGDAGARAAARPGAAPPDPAPLSFKPPRKPGEEGEDSWELLP